MKWQRLAAVGQAFKKKTPTCPPKWIFREYYHIHIFCDFTFLKKTVNPYHMTILAFGIKICRIWLVLQVQNIPDKISFDNSGGDSRKPN